MSRTIGAILDRQEQLSSVIFDIVSERKTSRSRSLTAYAIESGAIISDHLIDNNIVISFRAEIGNIDIITSATTTTKAADAYETLKEIYNGRGLIDYQTGFELFENMMITSLDNTEIPSQSAALILDIVLEQLTITETEQIEIPRSALGLDKTQKQLSSEINRGKQDLIALPEGLDVVASHEPEATI